MRRSFSTSIHLFKLHEIGGSHQWLISFSVILYLTSHENFVELLVFLRLPPLTNGFGSRHWKGRRKKASKYWRSLGVTSRQCADIDETGLNVCVSVRAWGATFNNVIWSENKLRLSIYRIFLVIHWKNAFCINDATLDSDPIVVSTCGFWKLQTSRLLLN